MSASLERFLENQIAPELVAGTSVAEGKLAYVFSGNGAQFPGMGRAALRANSGFAPLSKASTKFFMRLSAGRSPNARRGVEPRRGTDRHRPTAAVRDPGRHRRRIDRGRNRRSGSYRPQRRRDRRRLGSRRVTARQCRSRRDRAQPRQQRTRGTGRMAALALGGEAARDLLAELGSTAEIAALNAAHSVTVSGPAAEIERVVSRPAGAGSGAARSTSILPFIRRMEPIREELRAILAGLSPLSPAASWYRRLPGRWSKRGSAPSIGGATSATRCALPKGRGADRRRLSHLCRNRPETSCIISDRRAARGGGRRPGGRKPDAPLPR